MIIKNLNQNQTKLFKYLHNINTCTLTNKQIESDNTIDLSCNQIGFNIYHLKKKGMITVDYKNKERVIKLTNDGLKAFDDRLILVPAKTYKIEISLEQMIVELIENNPLETVEGLLTDSLKQVRLFRKLKDIRSNNQKKSNKKKKR